MDGALTMLKTRDALRIGCASGFWGDSIDAARQLVRHGDIDVLVFDYLAEITMSLLARAKARKPELGYVPDFVEAIAPLLSDIKQRGIRIVSNAGGINPLAAKAALDARAAAAGVDLAIAVVTGDDLTANWQEIRAKGVRDMFSRAEAPAAAMSANAYFGAQPIAAALDRGADVVITGRCVDSAVTLGALVSAFGWTWDDYDKLAQGSLCGHLLECGAQATGGLFTDWREVPGWDDMGFPVAECAADGSFAVTKPPRTGGLVTPLSVAEQMLYEIGDSASYILPDVVCDFRKVAMESVGPERVRVTGARGRAPTRELKVSATWRDGYRVISTVTIGGRDAALKAARAGEAIVARARRLMTARGFADFTETSIEVIGAEATYGPQARMPARTAREVVLKIAARHSEEKALEVLAREIAPAATAMAQGLTGFYAGRPTVQPVVRLFSFLWPKAEMTPTLHLGGQSHPIPFAGSEELAPAAQLDIEPQSPSGVADSTVPLVALAVGRSGDKGDIANIGIIARKPHYLPWIRAALTEDAVRGYFSQTGTTRVERFDLPGIAALNFLLHDALGGGGVASLRIDPQGKAFAQMLMDVAVPVPAAIAAEAEADAARRGAPLD